MRIYNTVISDIFSVCFDVMYSCEYNVFDVTVGVYPHRAGRKVSLTTVGIEPSTFGGYLWYFGTKSSIFDTTYTNVFYDHDPTFQPTRCGYTLRVKSKTQ